MRASPRASRWVNGCSLMRHQHDIDGVAGANRVDLGGHDRVAVGGGEPAGEVRARAAAGRGAHARAGVDAGHVGGRHRPRPRRACTAPSRAARASPRPRRPRRGAGARRRALQAQQRGSHEHLERHGGAHRVARQPEHGGRRLGAAVQHPERLRLAGLHRDRVESDGAQRREGRPDDIVGADAHAARQHDEVESRVEAAGELVVELRLVVGHARDVHDVAARLAHERRRAAASSTRGSGRARADVPGRRVRCRSR